MGRSQGLHRLLLWSAFTIAVTQVTQSDDVKWGGTGTQLAAVFTPGHATAPSSGWPAVFLLHGQGGNRKNWNRDAKTIAAEGIIAIPYGNDAYPKNNKAYPTTKDVNDMVNFFKDRAGQYNIDASNLFLLGYSKGGFRTTDTCFQYTTVVRGCVIVAGTTGYAHRRVKTGAPSFLVVHSTDDSTVSYSHVPPLIDKLTERGVPNELKQYTDAGHHPQGQKDFWPTVVGWMHGFSSEPTNLETSTAGPPRCSNGTTILDGCLDENTTRPAGAVIDSAKSRRVPCWLLWAAAASSARMA